MGGIYSRQKTSEINQIKNLVIHTVFGILKVGGEVGVKVTPEGVGTYTK